MTMRYPVAFVIIATLLGGLACPPAGQRAEEATPGAIVGTIVDVETGEGIISATVQVVGTKKGAMTGRFGNYRVKRMNLGTYTLRISHIDYDTVEIDSVVVSGGEVRIDAAIHRKETNLHNDPVVPAEPRQP